MRSTLRAGLLSVLLLSSLPFVAAGCADDEAQSLDPIHDCGGGETRSFLISTLGFTRVDPDTGTTPGFDVDGMVSVGKDEASCFKKDFTTPEGEKGIDNQLAALIPDVEAIFGDAVDGLIQGAINNGILLILIDVKGAANMENDECVDVTVRTVLGKPTLGTDGVIEPYQTYDPDPNGQSSDATSGRIEDGVLTIGPFELAIPIAIFDVSFVIHVHDALLRLNVGGEDGVRRDGLVGGGVVPQEIIEGVEVGAGVAKYIPLLRVVLEGAADLAVDSEGTCQQVSAGLAVTAVEAFVRE